MQPEEKIEALKNALREIVQMITSSGQPISNEIKTKLAQVMDHVANRITELRGQESVVDQVGAVPPQEPPLNQSMPSSNIHSFGYDPENERLLVKFQGNDGAGEGPVYGYGGVPKNIFDLFRKGSVPARTNGQNKWGKWWKGKVPSLGASLYTLIKEGGYPYQKLS